MGAVESVLHEVEKATIRPLGEVARGVEKVTIRPLGEVARGVERVTIRPLGEVARGVEKVTIRPLGEIARELEKVAIRPLGEVTRGVELVTIRPLGAIARELEKSLGRPLGSIASKTVLLLERLIDVVEQDSSMGPNTDMHARRENLNRMAEDVVQVGREINEAVLATPATDEDRLRIFGECGRVNSEIGHNIERLQNNAERAQAHSELVSENRNLRDQLNLAQARLRDALLDENNIDQAGVIYEDEDDNDLPEYSA